METTKKAFMGSFIMAAVVAFGIGSYNSVRLNNDAFMANDYGITFSKRLDEVNGKIVIGRMAASVDKTSISQVEESPATIPAQKETVLAESPVSDNEVIEEQNPAITDTDPMALTGGLFNGKALKQGDDFSAVTQVRDGIVEGFTLTLPGIDEPIDLRINQHDRMQGNVFQYEDIGTGEMKNALMYPVDVEKGIYMITLAADSEFPGMRLEFKVEGDERIESTEESQNRDQNFGQLNEQNDDVEASEMENEEAQSYDNDFAEERMDEEVDNEGYSF